MILRSAFGLPALAALFIGLVYAGEKKEETPPRPEIKMAVPFALVLGETNTFAIRGLDLTNATAARVLDRATNIVLEIKSRGKAEIPKSFEARDVGDTQVEAMAFFPGDCVPGPGRLSIEFPTGPGLPVKILLLEPEHVTREIEPNDGFKNAQEVSVPQTILGTIKEPFDVDVFRFSVKEPGALRFSISARSFGSSLDSILTLYDARGHILASNDDLDPKNRDSMIIHKFQKEGPYFISVIDAQDTGGTTHGYCLDLKKE